MMKKLNPSRILQLARPELRSLLIGSVFLTIGSAMTLLYPQAIRLLVDRVLTQGRADLLDEVALGILIVLVLQGTAGAIRYFLFTLAGERVVAKLRGDTFASIMAQEIGFFDARRTGELTSRLASDATVLQNTVSVNISMLLRNATTAVGGLGMLFYTSPILTVFMLAVIPPVALGAGVFGKRIRKISREVQDSLALAGVVAEETISGIRTVRAFAQEQREVRRYADAVAVSFQNAKRKIALIATFTGVASLVAYIAIVVMLWYGGHLVLQQKLTIGDLTSFILYTLTVSVAVGALGSLWTDFMSATGAAGRVFELLDRTAAIPNTGGQKPNNVQGQITLDHVSFAYPSRPDALVLKTVTFSVEPGTVAALVGPSGGGKSTIAGLIPRFYDPTGGAVLWDGLDVRDWDGCWLRQHIGVVAQDPVLMSTSIIDNIRYGREDASEADVIQAAKAAYAHDFIIKFPDGYQTLVGERGVQLSGGQRQRVAIARALLKNPKVLILDEATSALDTESEYLVKQALQKLMLGRTTIVIAHRLSTIRNADKVIVIDQGVIMQEGRHETLLADKDGLYARLLAKQFQSAEN